MWLLFELSKVPESVWVAASPLSDWRKLAKEADEEGFPAGSLGKLQSPCAAWAQLLIVVLAKR